MNTSNKGIVLESQRVSLLDNCKDAFEENPKEYQFLGQVLDNKNIRVELEKIMKNSPLFGKFFQEEEGSEAKEIKKSLSEEATKIKSKIAIEEEGKSELSPSTKTLLESHKMTGIGLLGSSVFTDLQIRGEERATISTSIISKSKFNITGLASTKSKNWKKKKQIVNENANFGSLPSVSISPSSPQESLLASTSEGSSVWATVKNWISKFVEKIKECTNIIYTKLRKNIIEYGLLILGVALLYSAGIIVEPTFYFTLFLQTLLSFFR